MSGRKITLVVVVGPDLVGRVSAVDLVRAGAAVLGGSGGGTRSIAQGGGHGNDDALERAFVEIERALRQELDR